MSLLLGSCQKFLDQIPDSSLDVPIDTEDKIAELLTGAYPEASYIPFLEPRTDNVEERVGGVHSRLNESMFYWDDYDQEDLDTPLNYWNSCYKGIAQANKALELLAQYPKTDRIKALYGEAFLLRAYLHFMLVNIWSEPYGGSVSNPGIPYLTKPEKNAFVDYDRGTVAETYDKIEQDLKLGITLVSDRYYKQPKFHFNKKAAYAFASRFYLMKGEWNLVVQYADYVLGNDPRSMLRPWLDYYNSNTLSRTGLYRVYMSPAVPANLLLTATESRLYRTQPTERYGATRDVVTKIFDKQGIEGGGNQASFTLSPVYLVSESPAPLSTGQYIAKFDELSLLHNTGTKPRGLYVSNVLFSADEVMLNRIEAYTMLREYDKAIDDLISYNERKFGISLHVQRPIYTQTNPDNLSVYTPFYGLTIKQVALIKTILDYRQKEFFGEGLRWFDLRRFYLRVTRTSKISYYKPLEKEDPRKTLQIPREAINRGLKPNPREGNGHLSRRS